jgi:hypothetical protein
MKVFRFLKLLGEWIFDQYIYPVIEMFRRSQSGNGFDDDDKTGYA